MPDLATNLLVLGSLLVGPIIEDRQSPCLDWYEIRQYVKPFIFYNGAGDLYKSVEEYVLNPEEFVTTHVMKSFNESKKRFDLPVLDRYGETNLSKPLNFDRSRSGPPDAYRSGPPDAYRSGPPPDYYSGPPSGPPPGPSGPPPDYRSGPPGAYHSGPPPGYYSGPPSGPPPDYGDYDGGQELRDTFLPTMSNEQVTELANEMKKVGTQFVAPRWKNEVLSVIGVLKDMKNLATKCDFGPNVRMPELEKCLQNNLSARKRRRMYDRFAMMVYDNLITLYQTLEKVGGVYRTPDLIIGDFLSCKHESRRASLLKDYYNHLMTFLRAQAAHNVDMKKTFFAFMPLFEQAADFFKALDVDRLKTSMKRLMDRVSKGLAESSIFKDIVHLQHILRRLENMEEPVYERFIKETLHSLTTNKTYVKELYRSHMGRAIVTDIFHQLQPLSFGYSPREVAVILNGWIESLDQFSQKLEGNGTDAMKLLNTLYLGLTSTFPTSSPPSVPSRLLNTLKLDDAIRTYVLEFYIIPSFFTFPAPQHLTETFLKELDEKFYSKVQDRPQMQLAGGDIGYKTLFILQFLGLMHQ